MRNNKLLILIGLTFFIGFIVPGCWGGQKSVRDDARIDKYRLKKSRSRRSGKTVPAYTLNKSKMKNNKKTDYKGPRSFYGVASYYGRKFHGKRTANGEIFNMFDYTAAHKTLPFGTLVKVTNLSTKRAVIVRINDRGPFIKGRDIDLSYAAAKSLNMIQSGTAKVKIEIVRMGQ